MNTTQRVASILEHSRAARNSDRELLIIFMQKAGMALSVGQIQLFRKLPSTETIRRCRQRLQEQGKYPADEAVEEARYKMYGHVRANIIDEDPADLLEQQHLI